MIPFTVFGDDAVEISVNPSGYVQFIDLATNNILAGDRAILASQVSSITVFGLGGNDIVDASNWVGVGILAYGGPGNDLIKGGSGRDQLYGEGGDDIVEGNGDRDVLYGDFEVSGSDAGNDILRGGDGNDELYGDVRYGGGTGNDTLEGGDGVDWFEAHGGDDQNRLSNALFTEVRAGSGNDKLIFFGENISLDLVASNKVSGIEEIDISGSGSNSLTVNQSGVLSLSDSTDTLVVYGNLGDTVEKGPGWVFSGLESIDNKTFAIHTQGAATLKLQFISEVFLSANTLVENAGLNAVVGTLSTVDIDPAKTFGYALVSGDGDRDNAAFRIDANTLLPNSQFDFETNSSYSIRVRSTDQNSLFTEKSFTIQVLNIPEASVANRRIFYNRSTSTVFGNGSGNPTNAIDPTKVGLLPGQTTSLENYTNYIHGLNGLIVDVANLQTTPTAADFQFATWNGMAAEGFVPTTAVATVTTIPGGGADGSTRLKIEFDNGAIRNTWLRVTVLANANTDLASNDVVYFGNAVGDFNVGNVSGPPVTVRTNASDTSAVRQNQSTGINSAAISNLYDINKDGRVNATDTSLVRLNQNASLIRFFTAPASLQLALAPDETDTVMSNTT